MFISAVRFQREKRYVYSTCIMLSERGIFVYSISIIFSEGATVCLKYLHYAF